MPESVLEVTGLASFTDEAVLSSIFGPCGAITRVKVDGLGGAHVAFEQYTSAQKAIQTINGAIVGGKKISVKIRPNFTKTSKPCKNFLAGKCNLGDNCKYFHLPQQQEDTSSNKLNTPTKTNVPTSKVLTDSKICRHFTRGFCSLGDSCSFKHDPASVGSIPMGTKACTFYAKGMCTKGTRCTFLHENAADNSVTPPATVIPASKTEQPQQKNTCIECEQVAASVTCEECEEKYCTACDASVHASKVMSRHTRNALATARQCGECDISSATVKCVECDESYCGECNDTVHKFKTLRKHVRQSIGSDSQPALKPVQKKQDNSVTKTSVTPQKSSNGYIDSIPKYELTSDSESDESDLEDVRETPAVAVKATPAKPPPPAAAVPVQKRVAPSQPAKAATSTKISTTLSKPRMELSSESSSDEDDDDVKAVTQPITKRTPVTKQPVTAVVPAAISSESSSESESEQQKPVFTRPVAVKIQVVPVRKPTGNISSESSEEKSDDDDIKYVGPKAASTTTPAVVQQTPSTTIPTTTSSAHSTSSSESSSEEEEEQATVSPTKNISTTPTSTYTKKDLSKGPRQLEFQQHRKNPRNHTGRGAQDNSISVNTSHSVVKKIEAYLESDNMDTLHLEPHLNGFERLLAHDCAERLGLGHVSVGDGLERHLTIFKRDDAVGPSKKKQRV